MRTTCTLTLSIVLAGALAPLNAQTMSAAPPRDARIGALLETLGRTQTPIQSALSPDGATVAWAALTAAGLQIRLTSVAHPDSTTNVSVSDGTNGAACASYLPTWSPDAAFLAFVSTCAVTDGEPGQSEIFIWSKATHVSRQLTHVIGAIESPAWSPDGGEIAFLFVENATRSAGALAAMKLPAGVIGEEASEVQRVGVVDVASGVFDQVTPPELHVYEFDWSPDSRQLAFVAAPPPGENNWWVAKLYTERPLLPGSHEDEGAAPPHVALDPQAVTGSLHGLQIAVPRWSPDGTRIALIGGLMSDQGSTGGDIYIVPAAGGAPRNITPGRPASPAFIAWTGRDTIVVVENRSGNSHVTALDVATGAESRDHEATFPETIGSGALSMSISLAPHGREVAFIRSSFAKPPEVWAGPISHLTQITHLNDGVAPGWGKTESISWTNDGFRVQGWLVFPANYDSAKTYPLVVSVHGGPSAATVPRWPGPGYGGLPFAAIGYFVFLPNPRGSFGQGERFTQANYRDFGYGDLRDILAGMDVLEKRFPIDPRREGITGWSYGGFMTMFAITQTKRFKAAVAGAGISDWQSYYGENSIDQWMTPFFGKSVYDDPGVYAKSSAINYIKRVTTPTLIVVGDRDGECPAPQSFEFWHALRAEGVMTRLVVYANEGHAFSNPEHRRDVLERALNWFAVEMPAE